MKKIPNDEKLWSNRKPNYTRCNKKKCVWFVNSGFRCTLASDLFRECRRSAFTLHFEKDREVI